MSLFVLSLILYSSWSVATAASNNTTNGTSSVFVSPGSAGSSRNQTASIVTPLRLGDCHELLMAGFTVTGAYKIYPNGPNNEGFYVYCDMDTDGGGWTVLQQRGMRGTHRDSFQTNDTNFAKQFGSTCGDGWIGLDALTALTSRKDQQVRLSYNLLQQPCGYNYCAWQQFSHYAAFKKFWIGSSTENYRLSISDPYAGEFDQFLALNGFEFFNVDTWKQKCPNKTFTAPGWYNSLTCTTPPTTWNLFGPLNCVPNGLCATEIKIRNPMGSILLDGVWMSYTSVKEKYENFKRIPRDCVEILLAGNAVSGAYRIFPTQQPNKFIYVYCDMTTDGGGWTTIMQRGKYSVQQESFDLSWVEYETGFGSTCADQFLGLGDLVTLSTAQNNELRIILTDWSNIQAYANYNIFKISGPEEKYRLTIGNYSGTAGDSLSVHSGARFTTRDQDNDAWANGNCAQEYRGAWWYVDCLNSNLNGAYLNQTNFSYGNGIIWSSWRGFNYSMKSVEMKIRNTNFLVLKKLVSLL